MLCEGNKCAQDCTWLGGNISICPHQVDFKENFKAAVSTWNEVFKSSTTSSSDNGRSKRSLMRLENSSSNIGFKCKCLNGYTGKKFYHYEGVFQNYTNVPVIENALINLL